MIEVLQKALNLQLDRLEEISAATNIDVEELRRFAFKRAIPDGMSLDSLANHLGMVLRPKGHGPLIPLEEHGSDFIQRKYEIEFSDAATILSLALAVIGSTHEGPGSLPPISKPRGLKWPVVHLCLGIYSKAIKHLRSAISLCELGLAEDANIVTRALFESNLALYFILQPRTKLKEHDRDVVAPKATQPKICPKCKCILKPPTPALKLKRLDTTTRAKHYVAINCIEREKELDAYLNNKMFDTAAVLGDEKEIRSSAKAARRGIGAGWVKRQGKTTYAGIRIRDLANSYKMLPYYLTIYRHQSKGVHGMNAGHNFQTDKDGSFELNLAPDPKRVNQVLFVATAIMLGIAQLLDKRLGLGYAGIINLSFHYLKSKSLDL